MRGNKLKIRRALLSVSDKTGIVELGRSLSENGTELVATGRTARVLEEAGLTVIPIERISGSPEAFAGRMKTLAFPVLSGILFRRGDVSDEADLARLGHLPVDCVIVNFYPFEKTAAREDLSREQLIEEVDIGGPTLVRAAAKNSPDVLVLTDPAQYEGVIANLSQGGLVDKALAAECAAQAWDRVLEYDQAIADRLGSRSRALHLRYGENPHQKAKLVLSHNLNESTNVESGLAWSKRLSAAELSYNNILDLSAAYVLAADLKALFPERMGVVVVKHNGPCGVSMIDRDHPAAQKNALLRAWEGDPVSAFGGVVVFTDPVTDECFEWLAAHFIEAVAAPGLSVTGHPSAELLQLLARRKNLKAVHIFNFDSVPRQSVQMVPGGKLEQDADCGSRETLRSVTKKPWDETLGGVAQFGIAVCRALKSNAVCIVREVSGGFQLVGAGQGQPNRVDALERLAIPRAQAVLHETSGTLGECVLVSDAFFPFRDSIDAAYRAGLRRVVQPGGSVRDAECVSACDEHGVAMAFTGIRHFRH